MEFTSPRTGIARHEDRAVAHLDHIRADFLRQHEERRRVDTECALELQRIDLGVVLANGAGTVMNGDLDRPQLFLDTRLRKGPISDISQGYADASYFGISICSRRSALRRSSQLDSPSAKRLTSAFSPVPLPTPATTATGLSSIRGTFSPTEITWMPSCVRA